MISQEAVAFCATSDLGLGTLRISPQQFIQSLQLVRDSR